MAKKLGAQEFLMLLLLDPGWMGTKRASEYIMSDFVSCDEKRKITLSLFSDYTAAEMQNMNIKCGAQLIRREKAPQNIKCSTLLQMQN